MAIMPKTDDHRHNIAEFCRVLAVEIATINESQLFIEYRKRAIIATANELIHLAENGEFQ